MTTACESAFDSQAVAHCAAEGIRTLKPFHGPQILSLLCRQLHHRRKPPAMLPARGPPQNFGSGACARTSSAASAFVATDGGEPHSGCWAVSFMQATVTMPISVAAIV